jgi:multidrug resistance efflux pump
MISRHKSLSLEQLSQLAQNGLSCGTRDASMLWEEGKAGEFVRREGVKGPAVLRKTVILVVGAVLTIGSGVTRWSWKLQHTPGILSLPGVVEVQEVRLGSKLGGRVLEADIAEGDVVEAGQVLVRFAAPDLEAQRQQLQARLQAATAELEKAQNGARREEIESAWASVEAAQAALNRLKAGARAEEIQQARSELSSAEADRLLAYQELNRDEEMYRIAAVSRANYDTAWAGRGRSEGRVAAARARLKLLQAGSRPEVIAEAAAQLRRAQANHRLLLAGTRSEDLAEVVARAAEIRAKLAEVEANLAEEVVRAPEQARVEVVSVSKGDLVPANQPVVRLLREDDLWVKAYVSETDLGKVHPDQAVEVSIDSHPGQKFAGVIRYIASQGEFTPRNVQSVDEREHEVFGIKVRMANPARIFKSGMAAEVHLIAPEVR